MATFQLGGEWMSTALAIRDYERRSSIRTSTCMELVICGNSGEWLESSCALSFSDHGVLIALGTRVAVGQAVIVRNPANLAERKGHVVRLGRSYGSRREISIEFTEPAAPDFWLVRRTVTPIDDLSSTIRRAIGSPRNSLPPSSVNCGRTEEKDKGSLR